MSEATCYSSTGISSILTWIVLIITTLIWESPKQNKPILKPANLMTIGSNRKFKKMTTRIYDTIARNKNVGCHNIYLSKRIYDFEIKHT